MPAPRFTDVYAFPPDGSCDAMRAEIDLIAARLAVAAFESAGGSHYNATRSFGPLTYWAVAICKHHHHPKRQEVAR